VKLCDYGTGKVGKGLTGRGVVRLHLGAEGCRLELVGGVVVSTRNHEFSIQLGAHDIPSGGGHAGDAHPRHGVGVEHLGQV
jgi:hypothetical protein